MARLDAVPSARARARTRSRMASAARPLAPGPPSAALTASSSRTIVSRFARSVSSDTASSATASGVQAS